MKPFEKTRVFDYGALPHLIKAEFPAQANG
jgi:hypothetical protein